jgi:hypothetical protein
MVSLKEHMESRIAALEKATEVAAREMNRRLEGMNEFRAQLDEQTRTFVDKDGFEHRHEAACSRIKELESFKDKLEGKASQKSVDSARWIALAGLALGIIATLLNILE